MVANTQPPDSAETWQRLVKRIEQAEEGLRERDQALFAQQAKLTMTVERLEHDIARLEGRIADLTPAWDEDQGHGRTPLVRARFDAALIVLLGTLIVVAVGSIPMLGSPIVLYTIGAILVVTSGIYFGQFLGQKYRQPAPLAPAAHDLLDAVGQDVDRLVRERTGR